MSANPFALTDDGGPLPVPGDRHDWLAMMETPPEPDRIAAESEAARSR